MSHLNVAVNDLHAAATGAVNKTSTHIHNAAASASQALHQGWEDVCDESKCAASDLKASLGEARQALRHGVRFASADAREQANLYLDQLRLRVRKSPGRSITLAAAVGALLGGAIAYRLTRD